MHKTLIFWLIPPFEIGPPNVNPLTLFRPSLPLLSSVPICYWCDPTSSNIPNRPKHLDSSKTVTRAACVTKPFRETPLHPHQGGVDASWAPKPRYNFSVYYANPFLLFPPKPLFGPASHSPALGPSAPAPPSPRPRGCRTTGGGVEIGLDSPSAPAIIARPYAGAHTR